MNRSLLLVLLIGALALVGCADGAADLGQPVPVYLSGFHRVVDAPFGTATARAGTTRSLREAIGSLAQGDVAALHADVVAISPGDAEALRRVLVGHGIDPARITVMQALGGQRTPSITLTRIAFAASDCSEAVGPTWTNDPTPSMMNTARCRQDQDLAATLVDPADLVGPPALGRGDGAYQAGNVRVMRAQVKDPQALSGGTGGSGASGGIASTTLVVPKTGSPAGP
jgi:type IV pilus biogenesis protein CpaD/CtpE